jgi:hypothetical protein
MAFNINVYITKLRNEIIDAMVSGDITEDYEVFNWIREDIDYQVMYYSDSIEIIEELNAYDWSSFDLECLNVSQVAYCAILEVIDNHNFGFDELMEEAKELMEEDEE